MKQQIFFAWLCLISISFGNVAKAAEKASIIVQSTTSTKNSGLYDYLLPKFTKETGIDVHVVAVGTGAGGGGDGGGGNNGASAENGSG